MKRGVITFLGLALGIAVYLLGPEGAHLRSPQESEHRRPAPTRPQQDPSPAREAPRQAGDDERWTGTDPAINQAHIFEGEINRRGKPVGYHSRPGGEDPAEARVAKIVDGPNRLGVYVAEVEIRNRSGRWLRKRSTFFPDGMSREEVLQAILHAWEEGERFPDDRFRGPSGEGFTIEGRRLDRGGINTAYPIFQERE